MGLAAPLLNEHERSDQQNRGGRVQNGVDLRKIVKADQDCSLSKRLVSAISVGIASGSELK
jgi:hypothetical protein